MCIGRWLGLFLLVVVTSLHAQLPPPEETKGEVKEAVKEAVEEIKKGDLEDETFKVAVEGEVDLNYVFAETPDSFIVTYKFHLEGLARNKVDLIKGKGQITTGINGYLAKWPTGACALNISVGELPFEMVFNKVAE